MRSRRLAAILGLLALLATVVVAGCGGDDSEPPEAAAGFGVEAPAAESEAISTAARRFLSAQAAGRWAEACGLMTAAVREQVEALGASSQRIRGRGCARVLGAIFRQNPAQLRAAEEIEVEAVRVQGEDGGYVFYSTPDVESAYLPLERQAGEWRVATISGSSAPTQQP